MRIMIEGCDGTGKTTLAKLYAEKFKLDYCHCTSKDPADYSFYSQSLRKENVVWDRHTIGELIYPQVFNRAQKISNADADKVIKMAKDTGVKIIILTSSIAVIRSRLEERKNEHPDIMKNLEYINSKFIKIADQYKVPVIDTSLLTLSDLFDLVQ